MQQVHVHFFHFAPTFAMIAVGAGRHNIRPDVLAAQMTRHHMVHRQAAIALSTILTGIIVAAKDLTAGQLDVRARSMNLSSPAE